LNIGQVFDLIWLHLRKSTGLIPSLPNLTELRPLLERVFPRTGVAGVEPLSGGLINTNLKITFTSDESPVVLRLYRRDPAVCLQEVETLRLVGGTVPVPEVLHVEPDGVEGSGPFSILRFVEGRTFQELKRTNLEAINEAAASVGQTLAAIGQYRFEKPGRLLVTGDNQLAVGAPYIDGPDPIPRILDTFLIDSTLQSRIGTRLSQQLHDFVWAWASLLPDLATDSFLVHCDFGNRNILVSEVSGKWAVAAVLDWEFALSGSPLIDVGHFLRYERVNALLREPFFSRAFVENGGILPENWRDVARVIDLTALVELLTHDYLPDDIASEILELIDSTLDQCRPE
jgi:aminoglycoside phosphotransferase (APT) family kinase protein